MAAFGVVALLGGCGDRESSAQDDLGEAGYSMTAEDFFRAAGAGDTSIMAGFLKGGFELESRDEAGDTVLHAAAAAGSEKSLEYLLDRGMSVDLPGEGGRTALAAAVAADQAGCVRYLLRNGADPERKDDEGYKPLMRAVEFGRVGAVEELAPYVRHDLDTALLMGALLGKPEMIDALTNYGASVYARTDDGRTALMVAAEQGHLGAARMLLEIGANRFALGPGGRTAAEIAEAAGHGELVAELQSGPSTTEFGLVEPVWSDEDLLASNEAGEEAPGVVPPTDGGEPVDGGGEATAGTGESLEGTGDTIVGSGADDPGDGESRMPWNRPQPGEGEAMLGGLLERESGHAAGGAPVSIEGVTVSNKKVEGGQAAPAIAMRRYREPALPMRVESVAPGRAQLRLLSGGTREVEVKEGSVVPGSRLKVVRIEQRIDHSKLNEGRPSDVSVVEVEDVDTGRRRQLVTGLAATAHDPLALVEDETSGRRYTVRAGDRFRAEDGAEYSVVDVRPNQLVLEHLGSGDTVTLPLRGPHG